MVAALTRRPLASLLYRAISSQSDRLPLPLINSTADATTYPPPQPNPIIIAARFKTTGPGYSPLSDPSLNWSNRPPKDPILPHGFDYEHWLILMEFNPKPTEKEMINAYVKTLATVVGSEKEAKKKIYKVCTTTYTGFGARISKELSNKVKGLPGVLWVLPDSYLDVANKDYGGYLFKNGKVIRRHEHRFIGRQITGNRPRPRYDRL